MPPGYFKALDIPVVRGRDLMTEDAQASVTPIVIASDFAANQFGGEDPIGRRLAVPLSDRRNKEVVVVGVVPAELVGGSETGPSFRVFALLQTRQPSVLLIRTALPAEPLIPTLRASHAPRRR